MGKKIALLNQFNGAPTIHLPLDVFIPATTVFAVHYSKRFLQIKGSTWKKGEKRRTLNSLTSKKTILSLLNL